MCRCIHTKIYIHTILYTLSEMFTRLNSNNELHPKYIDAPSKECAFAYSRWIYVNHKRQHYAFTHSLSPINTLIMRTHTHTDTHLKWENPESRHQNWFNFRWVKTVEKCCVVKIISRLCYKFRRGVCKRNRKSVGEAFYCGYGDTVLTALLLCCACRIST